MRRSGAMQHCSRSAGGARTACLATQALVIFAALIASAASSALQPYADPQVHRKGLWQDGEGQIGIAVTVAAVEHCAMQCNGNPECLGFSVKPKITKEGNVVSCALHTAAGTSGSYYNQGWDW